MIKSISFENFKGFKSLTVPEVAPITIIGGENNVGKTSLLEGIHLFYNINNPAMFMRHLSWRNVKITSADPDIIIAPIFYDFDLKRELKIAVDDDDHHAMMAVHLQETGGPRSIHMDMSQLEEALLSVSGNGPIPPSYRFQIRYEINGQEPTLCDFMIKRDFAHTDLQLDSAKSPSFPEQMRQEVIYIGVNAKIDKEYIKRFLAIAIDNRGSDVLEFLQTVEPQLTDISSIAGLDEDPMLYVNIGMRRKIPIGFTGDGLNRLFLIVAAIASVKNGVVLIDEIDSGIHYSHLTKVWEHICRLAREYNCQLIATTHNFECLLTAYNGVALTGRAEDFRFIRLDKRKQQTMAKIYTHDLIGEAADARWEVR